MWEKVNIMVIEVKILKRYLTICQNHGLMITYMIAFVVICAISDYMWLHDYVIKWSKFGLPSNCRCGHSCKGHSMIFITMVISNTWLHIWLNKRLYMYMTTQDGHTKL
jgi:hypothetical protein